MIRHVSRGVVECVLILCLLLALSTPIAAFTLPQSISSHMVLQRAPQQAQLWGTATPYSTVTVQLDSEPLIRAIADADGSWKLSLPAHPASVNHTLTLLSGDVDPIKLLNVAFGDIYLCGGQSNMEFVIRDGYPDVAKADIADSANYPNLRLFGVAKKSSLTLLNDTINRWTDGQRWVVSQPQYVNGSTFDYFSAVCFYYGRALYKAVNTAGAVVPIGLIDDCWWGIRAEAWITPAGLKVCGPVTPVIPPALSPSVFPSFTELGAAVGRAMAPSADPDPQTPSVLYNSMIHPLTNMRLTGIVWYQGESNIYYPEDYVCRFPSLINDWRQQFDNFHLHFFFVLLAAYKEGGYPAWPRTRDAQLAALALPYTGVGSAQDLGDEKSGLGAVHPRNKTILGERLSLLALHQVYGQDVVYQGPTYADITWPLDGQAVQTVILRFHPADPWNAGLQLLDTSNCDLCCAASNGSAITVVTSDRLIRRAEVTVVAEAFLVLATVRLSDPRLRVVSVQHNWEEYPQCALYNNARLPHLPLNVTRP